MNRLFWLLVLLTLGAGAYAYGMQAYTGQFPKPAKLYVIFEDNKFICKEMSFDASPRFRVKKGTYAEIELWPGTVEQLGHACKGVNPKLRDVIELKPGTSYRYFKFGRGWVDLSEQQGRAMLAARARIASFTVDQTATFTQLFGGRYYGPKPYRDPVSRSGSRTPLKVVGRFEHPGGTSFQGLLDLKRFYEGEMRYANGTRYIGQFGKSPKGTIIRKGKGRLIKTSGETFIGPFEHNQPEGRGICAAPGGAPSVCARDGGKPAPVESIDAAAQKAVQDAEQDEFDARLKPIADQIGEARKLAGDYAKRIPTAAQRLRTEDREMEGKCSCLLRGCLIIEDRDAPRPTEAQKRLFELKQQQQRRQCVAWQKGQSLPLDQRVAAEVRALEGLVSRENQRRTQLQAELARQKAELAKRQARERAEKLRLARAQEQRNRQEAIDREKRQCEATIRTYGFACGCSAFLPGVPKEKADGRKGGACPA